MSVIQTINDTLATLLDGSVRLLGQVEERLMDNKMVNVIGGEVVAIDDRYDTIIFHKVTAEPRYEPTRFTNNRVDVVELACYTKDGCNQALIESVLSSMVYDLELTRKNESAADVLKRLFLIEDPLKGEGYNPEFYAFSYTYEVRTLVPPVCCD